jgi:nucleoside-diphosphate-sugar epimerase
MNIMVTGATGFIGSHLVSRLLSQQHSVSIVTRSFANALHFEWFNSVKIIECDLHNNYKNIFNDNNIPDLLIHLSWSGLPNYKNFFHINKNLISDLAFLEFVINSGLSRLTVAGTCLEYGLQSGELDEELPTFPVTAYGFAKDVLRKSLEFFQKEKNFKFQWVRLFYMYGTGQNQNSFLAQLDRAIDSRLPVFDMSYGDQLRDFSSISDIVNKFVFIIENNEISGVVNCCSGKPISIFDLAKKRCEEKRSNIKLNRGALPYLEYEPMHFWGKSSKLDKYYLMNYL